MAKHPNVGDPAPDFELDGTDGRFKLSDHRGERVVLLFYPGRQHAGLHAPVLLVSRQRRGVRRARRDGGRHLVAERRLARELHRQARPERPAARRRGRQGGEGVRRPHACGRHEARGDHRGRGRASSATGTTTCSGSTSSRSRTCARRSSRFRLRRRSVRAADIAHHPRPLQRPARVGERRLHLRARGRAARAARWSRCRCARRRRSTRRWRSRATGERVRCATATRSWPRAAPTELLLDVPDAVPESEIAAAEEAGASSWADGHPFPTCVVCGPAPRGRARHLPGRAARPRRDLRRALDAGRVESTTATAACGRSSSGRRSTAPRARRSRTSARARRWCSRA